MVISGWLGEQGAPKTPLVWWHVIHNRIVSGFHRSAPVMQVSRMRGVGFRIGV